MELLPSPSARVHLPLSSARGLPITLLAVILLLTPVTAEWNSSDQVTSDVATPAIRFELTDAGKPEFAADAPVPATRTETALESTGVPAAAERLPPATPEPAATARPTATAPITQAHIDPDTKKTPPRRGDHCG